MLMNNHTAYFVNGQTFDKIRCITRLSVISARNWQHSHLPSAVCFFTPKMMMCTPENEETFYMILYIDGTKMRKK